ncbi:MAG TPA: Fe-S cluster assembly protein SufD, partial [Acidobacteriota bacterium]|nr:Fe-S cluster assembly protein SufD [Acidobacteriota bacterium]
DIFTALNTGLFQDAAVVYVPDGCVIEAPIELLFISSSRENAFINPRILIVAGKSSTTNIVESYVGFNELPYFCNAVTEIVLEEGAVMEHYKVQKDNQRSYHLSATKVHQSRDSAYTSLVVTLGSKLSRNELNVLLDGAGASCNLNGLYLIGGTQHADHQTMIDHARPYGTSQELYKGILDGESSAVFNGKILVRKDAQRTDAKQTNKNLLLSDGARVNTKPQLEILADDVKCNHGATIGHLEEDALFYLRSRGISARRARMLLLYGFINDVTARMKSESVRTALDAVLSSQLRQFAEAA